LLVHGEVLKQTGVGMDKKGVITIFGVISCLRLERTTHANAPRGYTPDNLPAALMS
jgi:hypothetical protein